ncbi:MAG TPA: hypothetical protein DHN33_07495 [Eubacteriaceae bacterium]|nr:hypothetical protein [Eubacteriaceae bacterium]
MAFAEHTFLVVLTTFIGSMTGISFGAFIAATVKGSENVKNGILTGLTMLGAFLSGMMIYDIKYIIQSNAPIVAKLNPLHLISDAYYSLYYFDDYSRYIENMVGLFAYMILFSTITYFVIRRRKYAGI